MGIYLGSLGAGMPQQSLYVSQVGALFQQMGGKTVPQGMNRGRLGYFGLLFGFVKNVLHAARMIFAAIGPFEWGMLIK